MLSARGFVDYCRSKGLKCVIRDDYDGERSNVGMTFSDEKQKLPDVSVSLDFHFSGQIDLLFYGFARYKGVPARTEVLRRLNTVNTASPFANFLLQDGEIVLPCSYINQPISGETLMEFVFFMVRLCCNVPEFALRPDSAGDGAHIARHDGEVKP